MTLIVGPAGWTADLAQRGWVVIPLRRVNFGLRLGVIAGLLGSVPMALEGALVDHRPWSAWDWVNGLCAPLVCGTLGVTLAMLIALPPRLVVDAAGIHFGRWSMRWTDVERIDVRHPIPGFTYVSVKPRGHGVCKRIQVFSGQVRDLEGFAGWLRFTAGAYGAQLGGAAEPLPSAGS
ncbi:MAG TPA: hypothetical protein VGJ44_24230 [Kribbellaceae bacterium]|jgi:hypothetical protein